MASIGPDRSDLPRTGPRPAAVLFVLPHGLNASGVTRWAVRLSSALAARGRACGLLLMREPPEQARLALGPDPRVTLFDATHLPPIEQLAGRLTGLISATRDAARALGESAPGRPVVISPNLHADAYAATAALSQSESERVRVVGWAHSDNAYDVRVLERYAPMLERFVGVSRAIEEGLRRVLPSRWGDIARVPYGVEVPPAPPNREALGGVGQAGGHRAVRLVYAGRLEHAQKRVLALAAMSGELARAGVAHELEIVGDGPARADLEAALRDAHAPARVRGPADADGVRDALDRADALVMGSRYEGLSVSVLEAMARGCVPIVTRTRSGQDDALRDGDNAVLADAGPDDDEAHAGLALARGVARWLTLDTRAMRESAWRTARDGFGVEAHADACERVLDGVAKAAPRPWPVTRACAWQGEESVSSASGGGGAAGSVPADGGDRLRALLASLAGRRVILHGAGLHTIALGEVLARLTDRDARVVALADDDRARWGQSLWGWSIVSPRDAGGTGATDVVISSWMHQDAIWSRREVYERQGLRVHRLYDSV